MSCCSSPSNPSSTGSRKPVLIRPLALAELRDDLNAYLIPEYDMTEQVEQWVMQRWRWFFEEQLGDWLTDPELWPEKRTPQVFRQFFDVEIHSMIFDVSGKALEIEDWSDDDEG